MSKWYEKHLWQVRFRFVGFLSALPLLVSASPLERTLIPFCAVAIGLGCLDRLRSWWAKFTIFNHQHQALHQQNAAWLSLVLHNANVGIWEWDIADNRVLCSDNTKQLLGLLPVTYEGFLNCVHPDDRARVAQSVQQALQTQQNYQQEFRVVWADGSVRWMTETIQLVYDRQGDVMRMIGTTTDITQQKQTELALQKLNLSLEEQIQQRTAQFRQAIDFEAMLKRITDKVRDSLDEAQILQTAVHEVGLGLGVRCCNAALYDLDRQTSTICYEYNPSLFSAIGQSAEMAVMPEIYEQLLQGSDLQFCNLAIDPIRGRVAMLACPIVDDQGALGDLWLMNDKEFAFREPELRLVQQVANQCAIAIRQARLYQESQAQVKQLEQLNRLKDDFLSTVSHELRTPVTNMRLSIGMLELAMGRQDQPQKVAQYLQILRDECDREIDLINDLLDLQQLELGKRSLSPEAIQPQRWLAQVVQPFQERALSRQQSLLLDLPAEPLPCLVSDPLLLDRILSELLNNACKYSPPGGSIRVSAVARAKTMQIIVTNTGVEIASHEMSRIFDRFYRIPNGDPWKQGGTGLGLALVQRLVERLAGSITITSGDRQTHFTLELPLSLQ